MNNLSWFVFRNPDLKKVYQYKISEGDILKIGRIWLFVKKINLINKTKLNSSLSGCTNGILNVNEDFNYYINPTKIKINNKNNDAKDLIKNRLNRKINLSKKDTTISLSKQESISNILNNNSEMDFQKNFQSKNKLIKTPKIKEKKNNKICRICYIEDNNINNPLIKPCKCSGTMKYIHINCLNQWIKTKIEIKRINNNPLLLTFKIKKINCELCKEEFPDYIKYHEKIYSLIDFEEIDVLNNNYIIFDSLEDEKNVERTRYIIKFNNENTIKIGRGIESNLTLNEVSISRIHSILTLNNDNEIYLSDYNSKFGTLVLVQENNLEISSNYNLTLQIGRTSLIINIIKPFSFFGCCKVEVLNKDKTYEKKNRKYIRNKYKNDNEIKILYNEESEKESENNFSEKNVDENNINELRIIEEETKNNGIILLNDFNRNNIEIFGSPDTKRTNALKEFSTFNSNNYQ